MFKPEGAVIAVVAATGVKMIVNISYYNNPDRLMRYYFFKSLPKVLYPLILKYYYKKVYKKHLNLKNPKLLSEKLFWSLLYDNNLQKEILTDKLKAKEYILKHLPELKTAKTYQVCSKFDDIDFSKCPKTFVIKTNHAWKSNILIEDKNKITDEIYNYYKKYYKRVLNINYAYFSIFELQYSNITPKIYVEEYLGKDNEEYYIKEYEVYCFNGIPEFINYTITPISGFDINKIDSSKSRIFDTNWNKTDFHIRFNDDIETPDSENKQRILDYAKKLSHNLKFVRLDFFEVGNQLYFGEFTFSPYGGFVRFYPEKYDLYFGEKLMM